MGKSFGLDVAQGWSMTAPIYVERKNEQGDCMSNNPIPRHGVVAIEMEDGASQGSKGKHEGLQVEDSANDVYNLLDLNVTTAMAEIIVDSMAIIHFQQHNTTQAARELTLFSVALNVVPSRGEENMLSLPVNDSGESIIFSGLQEVGAIGPRSDGEFVLGQYMGTGIQEASKVQNGLGLPFDGCEWPRLGPDLFNLMLIIEHNQKV